MNSQTQLWLFAMSVGASAFGGMLGMASGIFIVPILTIFGHIDIRTAIGASIVSVIACSCSSAPPFLKARLTNVRLAIVLETATTAGALSGVLLAGGIPRSYLFLIFGLILLLSARQMLAKRHGTALASTNLRPAAGVKGNPSIKSNFRGAIIHFTSAANKAAFDKNPSRYYPQYGGFCANHLRKGELVASDPTVFFAYKGKLFLCADGSGAKEFRSNMDQNIRTADEEWVTHFGFHGNPPLR